MTHARTHQWVDERSLAMAQATAQKLRRQPELLEVAVQNLRRWRQTLHPWPSALAEWEQAIAQGAAHAAACLEEDSPRGRRLRQSHPFAGVLTPAERHAILQQYESSPA